jgi:hypothetical protein
MFNKQFFDGLDERIQNYFQRFPDTQRVALIVTTNQGEYLLVEIIEYDDAILTFSHWPLEKADLPVHWKDVRGSLPVIAVPYQEIRSIEFDPKLARGSEIGFTRPPHASKSKGPS